MSARPKLAGFSQFSPSERHSACVGTRTGTSLGDMPRKPPVLTTPEKPTGRTKPERSPAVPKHRPDPGPEQFDLWGASVATPVIDHTAREVQKPRAKRISPRHSRKP